MKKIFVASVLVVLLSATGCSSLTDLLTTPPPPPPTVPSGPDKTGNDVCQIYNTLSWAVPIIEGLVSQGIALNDVEKTAVESAVGIINAGCQADNASWQQRATDAARALIEIISKFDPATVQANRMRIAPQALSVTVH